MIYDFDSVHGDERSAIFVISKYKHLFMCGTLRIAGWWCVEWQCALHLFTFVRALRSRHWRGIGYAYDSLSGWHIRYFWASFYRTFRMMGTPYRDSYKLNLLPYADIIFHYHRYIFGPQLFRHFSVTRHCAAEPYHRCNAPGMIILTYSVDHFDSFMLELAFCCHLTYFTFRVLANLNGIYRLCSLAIKHYLLNITISLFIG